MEDENGLELSLGLSCGGSSIKPKNGSSSDTRAKKAVRRGKMVDDFKTIFDAGPQKPNSTNDNKKIDISKPHKNFFSDLSKAKELKEENASLNLNGRGFWVANSNKPVQIEDDKQLETGIKRKMSFDEIKHRKKHEIDVHTRTSHISVTGDGLTAENEDVADSETENSNSMPILCDVDGPKQFIRVGASSDVPKDIRGVAVSSATDLNGEKRFTGSSGKDFKHANLTYGSSFSVQQVNMMNAPYPLSMKDPNSVHAPNPQISGAMHAMSTATGELSGAQPVSNGSLPVMFGYSSVQLSKLGKDNTWGGVTVSQQPHPSFTGSGPPNTAAICGISHNTFEAMPSEVRTSEMSKGDGIHSKQHHVAEESSSSQPEDVILGVAADVKFSGGGSCPNLPWVSTTGSGPNGRTISGVTYKSSTNQIRIVCACHGSHMTPEEFVRHANEDQTQASPEGSAVLGTVANGNPPASARS
ncbi:ninja-family protein mc410-like isoform X2 [Abrus precatorius]|uniref:Ninja-family protein n=1 Tax=Abrus precatorius TaxID=3816 RepID=A0A8B8KCB0_ABRPR|nr:ninja-family protein mc410-like isoform X2 [Abrus precatorius]